jgi:hypothetical protein
LKQVAELIRRKAGIRGGRIGTAVRSIVAIRVAVVVLAYPSTLAAQAGAPASAPITRPVALAVESELSAVFRTQTRAGNYALSNARSGYASYPMMAAMSWDAWRVTGNTAAASQATHSLQRYYGHLFSSEDRDGNHLLETPGPGNTRVEDPGYNAMVAIDAQRLARMNLELRRTMLALYWYDGARAVARSLVARSFDPDASYFFSVDTRTGHAFQHVSVAAALPACLDGMVGFNHADMVATRHLIPLLSAMSARPSDAGGVAARAVDRLIAVNVLSETGHTREISQLRSANLLAAGAGDAFSLYVTERAMSDEPLVDRNVAIDLFYALVRASGRFSDGEVVRLQASVEEVKSLANDPQASQSLESGERSVREVYAAVSGLRERLKASGFWGPGDRTAFPGVDPTIAAHRLTDDVLHTVRRAENRLFELRFGRGAVKATLVSNDAVAGEDVLLRWEVTSPARAVRMKSVQAGVLGESMASAPMTPGTTLAPGGAPLRFASRQRLQGGTGSLKVLTFMVAVETEDGTRARWFAERSVFVRPPVVVTARFPEGRLAQGRTVPIQVSLSRRSRTSAVADYHWFSPSGLSLQEGNSGKIQFSSDDAINTTLNIEIPSPCRPGVFPFTLKFQSNNRDAGTISSSLYKPYQWVALGPFPDGGGLGGKLPPEVSVGLLQSYAGTDGEINWTPVPGSACGPNGSVSLRDVIKGQGVSYLYTVVECSYETQIDVRLSANVPAALFVNGRRMAMSKSAADSIRTSVHLNADRNHILVKFAGNRTPDATFTIGNNDNLAADEFNNDLKELAEGYNELLARTGVGEGTPTETHRLVTFRLEDTAASAVSVVGSFNGWSPQVHRLQKRDGGMWEITLSLTPGRYAYRFLIDQKKQVLDPSTPLTEPDGFGGRNSVVIVSR